MAHPFVIPAAAPMPVLPVVAAVSPDHAIAALAGVDGGDRAGQHLELLLTAVAPALTSPVPRQLYRSLVWRYWLLALGFGIACWWVILALL